MKNSKRITEQHNGSITFVVDANLPAPEDHLKYPSTGREIAQSILRKKSKSGKDLEILAIGCTEKELFNVGQDVFFQTLVIAFAEHRPVVITPDMIWLLICQGFSYHIRQHPEAFRSQIVSHKRKKQLIVEVSGPEVPTREQWGEIIGEFAHQVEDNTKGSFSSALKADYSTTGTAEKIASEITLLDTASPYFEFVVHHMICGIPFITLKGTPEDWESMISRVETLAQFDLEWWTSQLIPILQEFVETAKGRPKASFWKSIVKTWRPGEMRGKGCGPWGPPATTVNGWFLTFFPYNRDGRTPAKISFEATMLPETVSVPFIYKITDALDNPVGEVPMNMNAGFIGVEEDKDTFALTPKIGWFISRAESDEEILKSFKTKAKHEGIELYIQEVPDVLRQLNHIKFLLLHFAGRVNLPDWMDAIKIDYFVLSGEMEQDERENILQRFPNCRIIQ